MGNLLRLLTRNEPPEPDVFVDFENAQPVGKEETDVYWLVDGVLQKTVSILAELRDYAGAGDHIREAMAHPDVEGNEEKAWVAVSERVVKLMSFYRLSLQLEEAVVRLLTVLTEARLTPIQHLDQQQALTRQLAHLLDFVLTFDELKMYNPSLQNDFSYYRRTVSRKQMEGQSVLGMGLEVDNGPTGVSVAGKGEKEGQEEEEREDVVEQMSCELANKMSLFYANATPMLKVFCDATTTFISKNKQLAVENTTDLFGAMATVCRKMVENPDYCHGRLRRLRGETLHLCLRVMVGVIILYDHCHPAGAFQRNSNVNVKDAVRIIKEQERDTCECLLNALRYTTKHLKDESTPKNIKQLLLAS